MEGKETTAAPNKAPNTTDDPQKVRHSCEWKNCPEKWKPHAQKLKYPGGAELTRPEDELDLSHVFEEERENFIKHGMAKSDAAIHHLVPISAFKGAFPDLTTNAELAGYKVNEKVNLMALPKKYDGELKLGLQYHAGGHGLGTLKDVASKLRAEPTIPDDAKFAGRDPAHKLGDTNYKDYVARRLAYTEKLSHDKCESDAQGTGKPQSEWLIGRLNTDSRWIRLRIKQKKIWIVTEETRAKNAADRANAKP